jgi:hypothetical protein
MAVVFRLQITPDDTDVIIYKSKTATQHWWHRIFMGYMCWRLGDDRWFPWLLLLLLLACSPGRFIVLLVDGVDPGILLARIAVDPIAERWVINTRWITKIILNDHSIGIKTVQPRTVRASERYVLSISFTMGCRSLSRV